MCRHSHTLYTLILCTRASHDFFEHPTARPTTGKSLHRRGANTRGGPFFISRKVEGPVLLRLREGGRKQEQKTEGGQGPRASRRLRVGVRKGPALQIHLRRGSKDPKYFTLGIWKCFQSLKAPPFFVVLHYQQRVLFAGPHCNMVVRSEKSRGVDFSPVAAHIRSSI